MACRIFGAETLYKPTLFFVISHQGNMEILFENQVFIHENTYVNVCKTVFIWPGPNVLDLQTAAIVVDYWLDMAI